MPYGAIGGFDIGSLLSQLLGSLGGGPAQSVGGPGGMLGSGMPGHSSLFGGFAQNTHSGGAFGANPYIGQLASGATAIGQRSGLPSLDAGTMNALSQITNAAQMKANQQFGDQSKVLTQQLYGMGAEHSSGANDLAARLSQQQGLVNAQIQADAASRLLGQQNTSADRSLQGAQIQQQGIGQAAGLTNDQNALAAQQQNRQLEMLSSLLPLLLQLKQSQATPSTGLRPSGNPTEPSAPRQAPQYAGGDQKTYVTPSTDYGSIPIDQRAGQRYTDAMLGRPEGYRYANQPAPNFGGMMQDASGFNGLPQDILRLLFQASGQNPYGAR